MNIAAFYDDLRADIGRGASIDSRLPAWCQAALNLLENEYTFQWMRKTTLFPLTVGANSNRVALGTTAIKAIDWVKYGEVQGTGAQALTVFSDRLVGVSPEQIISLDNGTASAFYLDGVSTLVLDALPQKAASLYVHYFEYSAWPTDTSQTPIVLARHYAGFKAHTMMTIAASLRDATMGQIWTGMAQVGKQAMLAADAQMEWKNRRDLRVGGGSL